MKKNITMIDAIWAAFHEEFPFPYFSTSFLTNDIESFDLLCTLYNAMHEFFFGNIYAAGRLICCIMDKVKFPNDVSLRQQANILLTIDFVRNIIENVIANNASDRSDYDSVTPLEQSNAANANDYPLVT